MRTLIALFLTTATLLGQGMALVTTNDTIASALDRISQNISNDTRVDLININGHKWTLFHTNTSATNLALTNYYSTSYTNQTDPVKQYIGLMRWSGCLDKVINQLAVDGEVCKVRGHVWKPEISNVVLAIVYPNGEPEIRACAVCGLRQTRSKTEWR